MDALPPPPFVLRRATVPLCVLAEPDRAALGAYADADGCALLDVAVDAAGRVAALTASASGVTQPGAGASVDLRGGMALPCFADAHTHIDKGHTWGRSPNADGSRDGAFAAALSDSERFTPEELARRVDFSLACAHAYGTAALRTHVNTSAAHAHWVWPVMAAARERWAGRVDVQLVGMCVPLSVFAPGGGGDALAAVVARHGGLLGASLSQLTSAPGDNSTSLARESLTRQAGAHGGARPADFAATLDALFAAAKAHNLDIDLHVDENADDAADALLLVAQATERFGWQGRVTAGHCCALALLPAAARAAAIAAAAAARVTVISLPTVNMYLQDRVPGGRTPRWRGVTLLHELKAGGVRVCVASDNTRDAFHAYGDLDMIDTFCAATRIAHLDHPHGDWVAAATAAPAETMGMGGRHGRVGAGRVADLVLLRARCYNEMMARSQHDRVVLRAGVALGLKPPPYEELDDIINKR